MDQDVAEILAYFRQNASDLKTLGKEWGLSDGEINDCITKAMSVNPKQLPPPRSASSIKFAARKSWPKLRVCLYVVGLVILLVCTGKLAMLNERVELKVGQLVQPFIYPLMTTIRKAGAPLHSYFNFYDNYYMETCIVNNPLFDPETELGDHICENCNVLTKAKVLTSADLKDQPLAQTTVPVLLKGLGNNLTFESLQNVLANNPFTRQPMQGLSTNVNWVSHIKDLLKDDAAERLAAQPDFWITWDSKVVSTSQIMRKVFPKPRFLKEKAEVAIRKTIHIAGPKSDTFEVGGTVVSIFSWFTQGSGSSELELIPPVMCEDYCHPFSVELEAGDILFYSSEIFAVQVKPKGSDMHISFLGHVMNSA